jgi:hypothetical protein
LITKHTSKIHKKFYSSLCNIFDTKVYYLCYNKYIGKRDVNRDQLGTLSMGVNMKLITSGIYTVAVNRINNDLNGNPRYEISVFEDNVNVTQRFIKGKAKKLIIQSYNIESDLERILQ